MYMVVVFIKEYWLLVSILMRKGNFNNFYSIYNFFVRY